MNDIDGGEFPNTDVIGKDLSWQRWVALFGVAILAILFINND